MRVLKVSTAVTVLLGPFLDKTDGVTEEAGLAATGTELSKAGGAFAAGPTLGTYDSDGWYPISLTTTHTNTLGDLTVKCHDAATHLPVWAHFTVIPANAYDGMVAGTGVGMRSDVQGWLGTAPAAVTTPGVPEVDVTHWGGTAVATAVVLAAANIGADAITAAKIADGAIDAATFAAGAINAAAIAADAITDAKVAADVTIASVTGAVGSVTGAVGSVAANVNAVLTNGAHGGAAATLALGGAGGMTANVTGNLSGSVGSVTGAVGSVTGLTASDVGAIKTKTDSLTFTVANQVDANAESMNAIAILGTGAAGDLWRG